MGAVVELSTIQNRRRLQDQYDREAAKAAILNAKFALDSAIPQITDDLLVAKVAPHAAAERLEAAQSWLSLVVAAVLEAQRAVARAEVQ